MSSNTTPRLESTVLVLHCYHAGMRTSLESRKPKELGYLLHIFGFLSFRCCFWALAEKLILTALMLLVDLFYLVIFRILCYLVFLWISFPVLGADMSSNLTTRMIRKSKWYHIDALWSYFCWPSEDTVGFLPCLLTQLFVTAIQKHAWWSVCCSLSYINNLSCGHFC